MSAPFPPKKIAIVGGGVAGISAMLELSSGAAAEHEITLFEAGSRLGGHACSVTVRDDDGRSADVDAGFQVFNEGSYPEFLMLLERLGARNLVQPAAEDGVLSVGFQNAARGLSYSVNAGLSGLLASPFMLLHPRFLKELGRFRDGHHAQLARGWVGAPTLAEFLSSVGAAEEFADLFAYPLTAGLWSASTTADVRDFPAREWFEFFHHHHLMAHGRGKFRWMTLKGGVQGYLEKARAKFGERVRLGHRVERVTRVGGQVSLRVHAPSGGTYEAEFDRVVLAVHADVALSLLDRPSDREATLLGKWRYRSSVALLHTDASVLPGAVAARAALNVRSGADGRHRVSWHLNRVRRLPGIDRDYFLTVDDPEGTVRDDRVIERFRYSHPVLTPAAMTSQKELPSLNIGLGHGGPGTDLVRYCGSYFGLGSHEDAVRSARAAVRGWAHP